MSDSSNLSRGNERIAARLRLIGPGQRWDIFEGEATNTDGLDAFCVVSRELPTELEGFELRLQKTHRIPEKLGHMVECLLKAKELPSWLGAFCRPGSMVGVRVCYSTVPGVREYYYQRAGEGMNRSATGDFFRNMTCSVFGLGHTPLIGATAASLLTCMIALAATPFLEAGPWKFVMLALALTASLACLLFEKWAHRYYVAEDPREVVLDEVAGMALALAIGGPALPAIFTAFFAFRFFDIFKPGIHWIEESGWPGVIVWDDLLAGLYAGGALILAGHLIFFIFS
ncbi:MAG: Undecaprenyl-diphosphatase [Verrucomicrobiota bacterium]|jgi:phosphatidylglycerophosphatase A